ncbi:alanine--tRNA ligase [Metamycoplasma hyosynoviae]|uniref:alanine--tRNA ligase n=1 Tax=Metamycoplasma hyosynoviae TaxID=29559 RepID=UPI0023590B7E|nr:alanine--tRNA ligase [Metamycoplasma hyosynoviae]MDC8920085.1 alanine--tRNA ligase [Metamycoplasma hyosynoviae]MDD1366136.1 alanine--tRNA ligase [Metamycoplasma hyosynoviae]MDD7895274.1 alanine--tRNA ligase [Metamycoplasma hyosynoviae]
MTSKEIRQKWLDFFASKNHMVLESKSLIPQNDPSLLWINSGVATLKDFFSGKKIPPAKRLTNSQKSIRTNDIENVGVTARHHTFFEMLGNFSIGDYFKKEAIAFAYEFIFDVLKFEKSKIYITYFSEDKDTYNEWIKCGISKEHLIKGTRDTNFWDVGQGPCGPDTEIFYDRGEKYDKRGIELLKDDIENDRYIEIWNIVFSQFNNDGENNYTELATKNIDTGAGLERITSIIQDAPTNFDTDLFLPIIREIERYTSYKYDIQNYFTKNPEQTKINTYFKIIADHMRASVNAINDGVVPSNVGRGYIIRRLIRRSYRAMLLLGIAKKSFLYKLTKIVKDSLIYDVDVPRVEKVIQEEEMLFAKTISSGEKLIESELAKNGEITIKIAFKMFDTYGFPIELTKEILQERKIKYTWTDKDFQKYIEKHQELSRSNIEKGMDKVINSLSLIPGLVSEFVGYDTLENKSEILYLLNEETSITKTNKEDISYLILKQTPFYATSGGQNHDFGYMKQGSNKIEVLDIFKDKHWNHIHKVRGKIDSSKPIECYVDKLKRQGFARGHSSTHLLYNAIRKIYPGEKIEQLGSNITPDHFTFDFGLDHKPTKNEIRKIENVMREYIAMQAKRTYIVTSIKEAERLGAWMTIEESEYHDANKVRVVKFDGITLDLCGGTHAENSKDIEDFKIISVDSKGTGVYRLRVITSTHDVISYLKEQAQKYQELLLNLININKKFDSSYTQKFASKIPSTTSELEKLLLDYEALETKIREDYKTYLKEEQNKVVEVDAYKSLKLNGIDTFIFFAPNVGETKKIAVSLREKYANALIVGLSKLDTNYFLVVASKEHHAKLVFDKLTQALNGKGGGNELICQGSIQQSLDETKLTKKLQEVLNA